MRIEVICTGDEVLTGKIVNTNFASISQRLEDVGLSVAWETTVGDDRESLLRAFQLAGERADAVIVNGGLGPTVDDLSQEVAAQAAGVELALNEEWLTKMEDFFRRRSRTMPPNNRKQAMLPTTAEVIDNPIGTACGFAIDIGRARFFFTPGVPRELKRMLEEQIIPPLLAKSWLQTTIQVGDRRHVHERRGRCALRPPAGRRDVVPPRGPFPRPRRGLRRRRPRRPRRRDHTRDGRSRRACGAAAHRRHPRAGRADR